MKRVAQPIFALWADLTDGLQREKRRRAKYRQLFSTPLGQEVLADMMMSYGFMVADAPSDPHTDSHRNGARWVIGDVLRTAGVEGAPLARAIVNDDLTLGFE